MAKVPVDLLSQLQQNEILQLKAIIATDFDHLSVDQKKFLHTIAIETGYKTNLELFLDLKNHPEKIGLPAITEDEFAKTTLRQEVVAANLAKYLEDKETLDAQIDQKFQSRTEKDRALIKRLVEIAALRRQTEVLIANANANTRKTIADLDQQTDPKNQPLSQLNQTSREIVQKTLSQTSITITRPEELAAVALITTAILAGIIDPGNSESLNEIIQAAIPKLNSPISQTFQEIEANLTLTTIPRYDDINHPQLYPNVSLDITKITLPETAIETPTVITLSAPEQDRVATAKTIAQKYSEAILLNQATDPIMSQLVGAITPDQRQELFNAVIADNLVDRSFPTQPGAASATVLRGFGSTRLDPVAVELTSMGLTGKAIQQKIASNPNSNIARFVTAHPEVLIRLNSSFGLLENKGNALGAEISPKNLPLGVPQSRAPGPLSGLSARYQSITNRLSGLLPGNAGQIFSAAAHPFQFVQGKIGNFIGNRIVGQFKNWLAEKVVSKIANETLKKAAGFVLKKGLQEGVKLLAKEGLKRGLQAIAQLANIAPGAGLLIAAAIEVGSWVLEKTFGLAKNTINGFSRALTGEDFDGKALLAAPLIALAGLGGVLGSLAAATAVAISSAALVIMGSAFVGFFLYMTVITVAPIITTIAHLESGISDVSRVGVIGESPPALLPPGPLPDSCPQGPPVTGYAITQGPSVGSHTSGWSINIAGVVFVSQGQAIDYGTPMNTPVYATHNGQAYYYQEGDNQPAGYGNYVAIIGNCPNPATGQTIQFLTTYAHLNAGNISRGGPTSVTRGQLVGLSDNTGHSSGPHLHYEIFGLGDIYRYVGP